MGGGGRAVTLEADMLWCVLVVEIDSGAWGGRCRWRGELCSSSGSDVNLPGDDWCLA
jgi:hypothetical protein